MEIAEAGRTIIAGGGADRLYGLSPVEGSIRWIAPAGGWVQKIRSLGPGGPVAIISQVHRDVARICTIDPSDGRNLWSREIPRGGIREAGAAGGHVVAASGELLLCLDLRTGEVLAERELQPLVQDIVDLGDSCLLNQCRGFRRLRLPSLEDGGWLESFPVMVRSFLRVLGPDFLAAGFRGGEHEAILQLRSLPSLDLLCRIPIPLEPVSPVRIDDCMWACLLVPFHGDGEQEAAILLLDLPGGRTLHREPLGCRPTYPGSLAAEDGRLFVTYEAEAPRWGDRPTKGRYGIRAYETSGE